MSRSLTPLVWFPLLLATVACGDKESETEDPTDDLGGIGEGEGEVEDSGTASCDGTWSIVAGQVTGPYSDDPTPDAQVYVWGEALDDEYATTTDSDGMYELTVPPGTHNVEAYTYEGCWSYTQTVDAEACATQTIDINIEDCDVADKPNLYLYPEQDTPTDVLLHLDRHQSVVASIPPYTQSGWHGIAHPDGTWTNQGALTRDPFLFYEVSLAGWQSRTLQRSEGICIPHSGVEAVFAMADLLGDYGFNAAERDDFVDAWIHDLPPAESYAVYPQLHVDHMAGLDIQPALPVDRLWLVVDDGAGCSPRTEPLIVPFDRSGAHAVEWGVVLGNLVR